MLQRKGRAHQIGLKKKKKQDPTICRLQETREIQKQKVESKRMKKTCKQQ